MWADNETKDDLLGYQVHADLLRDVVFDPKMLPISIGVFGDWGSGKSSLMLLMQESIEKWRTETEEANKVGGAAKKNARVLQITLNCRGAARTRTFHVQSYDISLNRLMKSDELASFTSSSSRSWSSLLISFHSSLFGSSSCISLGIIFRAKFLRTTTPNLRYLIFERHASAFSKTSLWSSISFITSLSMVSINVSLVSS